MDWKIVWEAAKEPLRILVLAVLPIIVAYFASIPAQWAIGATLILRFVDSYLHNLAKEEPKKTQNDGLLGLKGLTGF